MKTLNEAAAELQRKLDRHDHCIVFAESCTAGLIAATLGRIPGISQWLAGSAVVYQLATKTEWLEVNDDVLENPGPVSQVVSEQMAAGVLRRTAHATIAASVTGHLGPDAPEDQDGIAWATVAKRTSDGVTMASRQLSLDENTVSPNGEHPESTERRHARQKAAAKLVLQFCIEQLS